MARCVVVLADGLRPDAITPSRAPSMSSLARDYTSAACASTVRPSVTVAALASLATGVSPRTHGLVEPGLGFLTRLVQLRPVARELARLQVPTLAVAGGLPARARPAAWALAACAGVTRLLATAQGARAVSTQALELLVRYPSGLLFVYLPDADQAGHAHGWMSPEYLEAVGAVDAAVGRLSRVLYDSLLVVLADHGGGGAQVREHDQAHPVNERIPLVLAGPMVARRRIVRRPLSILDVPPTVLAWLGVPVPAGYEGRPIAEAFGGSARRRVRAMA